MVHDSSTERELVRGQIQEHAQFQLKLCSLWSVSKLNRNRSSSAMVLVCLTFDVVVVVRDSFGEFLGSFEGVEGHIMSILLGVLFRDVSIV